MSPGTMALAALLALGCASAEREAAGTGPVVGTLEVVNASGDPVTVTARVGNSAEQQLGFLGPGESSIFRVPTGASPSGELFLRARGPDGREANATLPFTDGTLRWEIPPLP